MIYKPYSLLPSDLEDGSNVIDIMKDVTFTFMVTGTTPIGRMGIQIGDLEDTNPTAITSPYYIGATSTAISDGSTTNPISVNGANITAYSNAVCSYGSNAFRWDGAAWRAYGTADVAKQLPTPPIYYTNLDGSAKLMSMTFPSSMIRSAVGTTSSQKWRVWIRDVNNEPTLADWVFVKLRTTPSVVIHTDTSISTKKNTWTLSYTPSYPYENGSVGTTVTNVRSVRWRVFDKSTPNVALYDTGEIFGCVEPTYTVDGLMSEHTYYAEVTIVNQDGVVTTATSSDVAVSYALGPSGIMEMLYTDEIAGIAGDVSHGREVALNFTNFSGENGESSMGSDGYKTVNIGDPTGYVLENYTGNTISWSDISFNGATTLMVRTRFTPLPFLSGNDIATVYVTSDRTKRVRYAIGTGAGGNTLFPAEDLYPSDSLFPNVGEYFINGYIETLVDGTWELISTYQTELDIHSLSMTSFVYYEHLLSIEDFGITEFGPNLRVEIHGQNQSRFAYFVIDHTYTSYQDDADKQIDPPVTDHTVFAVFFNNILHAVNLSTGASPERVTFYRYQDDESTQFKIAQIILGESALPTHLIDFTVANGESYKYIMYPEDDTKVYAGTYGYRPTDGGDSIEGYVECEMLVTSRWDSSYNAYIAERVFYFDFNNKPQPINNNAVVQKNQTFGRFFHIQHGATNVLSGQINGLIGYLDCSTGEFVSDFEIEDAIRWLTTDNTTKLYKSARGYVLPVDITSAITFTPVNGRMASDVSFEWTEVKLQHPTTVIGVMNE